tara:strand:+ start:44 stop:307 length:264 start_codon:yes stop_codon:yes gene_type:complete
MTQYKDVTDKAKEELDKEKVDKLMDQSVRQIYLHVNKKDPEHNDFFRVDYHSGRSKTEYFDRRKKPKTENNGLKMRRWDFVNKFLSK